MNDQRPVDPQPAKLVLVRRGIRQREVARALGVSDTAVAYVLNGRRRPSVRLRDGIADFLGLSVEALFHDEVLNGPAVRTQTHDADHTTACKKKSRPRPTSGGGDVSVKESRSHELST